MNGARLCGVLCCTLAVLAALVVAAPAHALADGDPASDYLYTRSTFTPAGTSAMLNAQLRAVVAGAHRAGEPIKVAVIGSPYDLGSITPLWKRPGVYARFLGIELSIRFRGVLLVVMPNGFGIYHHGLPVARVTAALARLQPGAGTAGLVASASTAVRMISAADHRPILATASGAAGTAARPATGHRGPIALTTGLFCVLAVVAAWAYSLRRRPLARRGRHRRPAARRWIPRVGTTTAAFWVLWVMAASGIAFVGVKHFVLSSAHNPVRYGADAAPTTWRSGAYRAPEFALRDQTGHPISVASSRGKVTILAFLDPTCRNLCPEEASVLGSVERKLGRSGRIPIVAVSVAPWGQQQKRLLRDIRDWRVGPTWDWAVGTKTRLARVWSDYKVGVQIKRLHVGGVTVHEVFHDELIYIVDGRGDIRALYPYPFSAAQVVSTVRSLQS